MQVQVYASVNEISSVQFGGKTVIVIDVLRATSTIVSALAAGAASVTPAETVMDARAAQRPGELLGGERYCKKIAGFDLGNSPDEYNPETVADRRIILTTTNGTRALHKAMRADYVLAAAMLNASACAKAAVELRRDVVLLCAGAHDRFAAEDGLCAGLLIKRFQALCPAAVETDDLGTAMLGFFQASEPNLLEVMSRGVTGRKLIKLGLKKDVERCAEVDALTEVPRLNGNSLILSRPVSL